MSYTPAPWTASQKTSGFGDGYYECPVNAFFDGTEYFVAFAIGRNWEEAMINAKLIAAAPLLLEAFEDAPDMLRNIYKKGYLINLSDSDTKAVLRWKEIR